MANTYKNIVITPNITTEANVVPTIRFSGGDGTSNTDINLRVYTTQSGTLSFEGSAGQLFSITNDLTNSIFSVNDVSGIPSIDVFANGNIYISPFGGNVSIDGSTLYVDAIGNEVGIGTSAPTSNLHVIGTANITSSLLIGTLNVAPTIVAAFGQANTAATTAIAAFGQANTASTTAVAAFGQANTAATTAAAAFGQANTAATTAVAAFSQANVAFTQANTAATTAVAAFSQANTANTTAIAAFGQANTANATAAAAFARANAALANATGTFAGTLTATGDLRGQSLYATFASGDEGGEVQLTKPPNGTLSGGVTIDAYQDRIRFFEQGGTSRGAFIDLKACATGAGTNLLSLAATSGGTITVGNTFSGAYVSRSTQNTINFIPGVNVSINVENDVTNSRANVTISANVPGGWWAPTTSVVTGTSVSAVKDTRYFLTNNSATTVTLPATPTQGDTIYVVVTNQLANNVIARNGNKIMSLNEDLTLDITYYSVGFTYIDTNLGWVII